MWTISTDWKLNHIRAGAQAAIRHSIAALANPIFFHSALFVPRMIATSPSLDAVQIRCQGTGPGNTTLAEAIASDERISHSQPLLPVSPVLPCHRPRLSTDSRHTASTSCVSHVLHSAYAPPVPSLPAVYSHNENAVEVDVSFRPLQIAGSLTLSLEDIRVKDDDDILPALASKSFTPSLTTDDI
ncbi:hypothetical protein F5887DRAFT_1068197 [Amanita rubescens]|nr:hypothetical protein F5887DRAFT_1068197 [Amanita rubescens]